MNFRTIGHYNNRINSLRAKNEVANAALIRKCRRRLAIALTTRMLELM